MVGYFPPPKSRDKHSDETSIFLTEYELAEEARIFKKSRFSEEK